MLSSSIHLVAFISTITACGLAACDPHEDTLDAEDRHAAVDDARAEYRGELPEWDGPVLSPDDPTMVPAGDWDVMALSDTLPARSRTRVLATARGIRGAILFSVQEDDHMQFVVATPHQADDTALVDRLWAVLTEAPTSPRKTVCNRLYRHPFWQGSQFMICGEEASGSHGYKNLAVYGFDNVASSYFIDSTTNDMYLYNGTSYTNFLVHLEWDKATFPSAYNDKATSIIGTY